MTKDTSYEESLKAVHHAEKEVYESQSNTNAEERQQSFQQLQIAKEKVQEAKRQLDENSFEEMHRLLQAEEQLRHLMEAQQSFED
ncbi:hypothetical protein ACOI1C_22605 [Bacillus sp. DJP31]|uniref:hypothetical protein n=1 Tax=Bacillus sp. DJP31 TaxID=3409789 RepID=UPI003BB4E103